MKEEELRAFPKVELHCHLDGSLSRSYLEKCLGRPVSKAEISVSQDCRNLEEYLEKFDLPLSCLHTKEALSGAAEDVLHTMSQENVRYAEIRFAPLKSVTDDLDCAQVIEAVLDGLKKGEEAYGIKSGLIVCTMRGDPKEENYEMLKTAQRYLGKGVCGADLAGAEASYPMTEYRDLFFRVKYELRMPFTIHAGECGNAENIMEALHAGARRIGHGIAMAGHTEIKRMTRVLKAGVEMCPSSNLQTKAVMDLAQYPLREFLREGLLVSINTDNRTVSDTSLTKELRLMQEACGVTDEEIWLLTRNAVQTSFADEEIKKALLKELEA